jgi:hypothetical protein
MSDPRSDGSAAGGSRGGARPYHRPAPLLFEPTDPEAPDERFFDLESIEDPGQLLGRATELALAFRAAAERATDFQALAAARLADPRRFDRLDPEQIADRAGWTPDYARRMVAYGRDLERSCHDLDG